MACCTGTTRSGRRCAITERSSVRDELGRDVASTLRYGAPCCLFHAKPFCALPAAPVGDLLIFFLDFETTGVDPTHDRVVEMAAVAALGPIETPGPCFSTVLRVDAEFLQKRGGAAAAVHGITAEEISQGPGFACAWNRFVYFAEHLANSSLQPTSESDDNDEEPVDTRIADEPPTIVIAAHNGVRFDFCMLLFECARSGLDISALARWLYVDTLSVLSALPGDLGGCLKLQCLARWSIGKQNMRAHRALDDCVVLREVMEHVAALLGLGLHELFRLFTLRLDVACSGVYMNALDSTL